MIFLQFLWFSFFAYQSKNSWSKIPENLIYTKFQFQLAFLDTLSTLLSTCNLLVFFLWLQIVFSNCQLINSQKVTFKISVVENIRQGALLVSLNWLQPLNVHYFLKIFYYYSSSEKTSIKNYWKYHFQEKHSRKSIKKQISSHEPLSSPTNIQNSLFRALLNF